MWQWLIQEVQPSDNPSPATERKLTEIVTDQVNKIQELHVAMVIDAGEFFDKVTEGDCPLALTTYEELCMQNLQFHKPTTLSKCHGLREKSDHLRKLSSRVRSVTVW